ncbi:MAG: hypothetical protein AMXMBFR46_21650 [Acidimicrobiia bacterium]
MTRYAEHLADAWSEFWSTGDARAAVVIYARGVQWWDVGRGRGTEAVGPESLAAVHRAHHWSADRFGVHVRRLVAGASGAAVEFVATARDCHSWSAAPGCAFWRVDGDGRITHERWYWDWSGRQSATPSVEGHTVPGGGARDARDARDDAWYRRFATDLLRAWDASPVRVVDRSCAGDVVLDLMGRGPDGVHRGSAAVRAAMEHLDTDLVERSSRVDEVVGAGPLVAVSHLTETRTTGGPRRTTPVAQVLTLDDHDQIVSSHAYVARAWPRGRR